METKSPETVVDAFSARTAINAGLRIECGPIDRKTLCRSYPSPSLSRVVWGNSSAPENKTVPPMISRISHRNIAEE